MNAVEVLVRFGDTTVGVTQITPGGSYRIGTARDVDLPVEIAGMRSFPLVGPRGDGFVVRRPAGIAARAGGRPVDDAELVPQLGETIELALGRVALEVTLVARAVPLERPRLAARGASFALASLIAHLAVLWIADAFAEPEVPVRYVSPPRTATVLVRADEPPVIVKVPPKRQAAKKAAAAVAPQVAVVEAPPPPEAAPAQRRAQAIASARRSGATLGAAARETVQRLAEVTGVGNKLDDLGPVYREYEAQAKEFGGGGTRFRVDNDPRFASVKSGRYETVAAGRAAGEYYDLPGAVGTKQPPRVELVTHPAALRAPIEQRVGALTACYERAAQRATGQVTVEFDLGEDGVARNAVGRGLGEIGACVAGVVARTPFGPSTTQRVTVSLAFRI